MAIILEAITHVWHHGRMLEPGEIFSAEETFAKKLIEGNSAKVKDSIEKTTEQIKNRKTSRKVGKNE